MSTLIESLERDIPRLEAEFGSDNQFVKDSKEQLRAMKENAGKTTQDVYRMQAVNFSRPNSVAGTHDPAQGLERAINKRFGPPSTPEQEAQEEAQNRQRWTVGRNQALAAQRSKDSPAK